MRGGYAFIILLTQMLIIKPGKQYTVESDRALELLQDALQRTIADEAWKEV
jgi:hypothetical protein